MEESTETWLSLEAACALDVGESLAIHAREELDDAHDGKTWYGGTLIRKDPSSWLVEYDDGDKSIYNEDSLEHATGEGKYFRLAEDVTAELEADAAKEAGQWHKLSQAYDDEDGDDSSDSDGFGDDESWSDFEDEEFDDLDADGDGFLSVNDLLLSLPRLSRREAHLLVAAGDRNGDGKLSREAWRLVSNNKDVDDGGAEDETSASAGALGAKAPPARAKSGFDELDFDGDGQISAADFRLATNRSERDPGACSAARAEAFVAKLDRGDKGFVSREDWAAALATGEGAAKDDESEESESTDTEASSSETTEDSDGGSATSAAATMDAGEKGDVGAARLFSPRRIERRQKRRSQRAAAKRRRHTNAKTRHSYLLRLEREQKKRHHDRATLHPTRRAAPNAWGKPPAAAAGAAAGPKPGKKSPARAAPSSTGSSSSSSSSSWGSSGRKHKGWGKRGAEGMTLAERLRAKNGGGSVARPAEATLPKPPAAPAMNTTGAAAAAAAATVTDPTEEELRDFSAAARRLWELDHARLQGGEDFALHRPNRGGGGGGASRLFQSLDKAVLRRPTVRTLLKLFDNYNAHVGRSERTTAAERRENAAFLHACMRRPCMRFVQKHLLRTGAIPAECRNPRAFIRLLNRIWFKHYRRRAANDSSGFEHVFVGERKDGKITGFHNWLQFWNEERRGNVQFIQLLGRRDRQAPHAALVTTKFKWFGDLKSCSSSFVGVSPEFELALYTLAFFLANESNKVNLGGFRVDIKCFSMGHGAKSKVGTAFPCKLEGRRGGGGGYAYDSRHSRRRRRKRHGGGRRWRKR